MKETDQSLLGSMIWSMQRTQDTGLKAQITEVMRLLLDSTTMELNQVRDEFLNIFYDKYMDSLLSPFLQVCAPPIPKPQAPSFRCEHRSALNPNPLPPLPPP